VQVVDSARQPGHGGEIIRASEKWLLKALRRSDPIASRCERSSDARSTVQFDTPKSPIRPASTSASSASVQAETGYDRSSRCRMKTSMRSTPSSAHASSTSAATRSGRQFGGWQPFA
jgi:hypothetical protein